ncbi:MAG TPA: hypothetical protein VNJ01_10815 [Bacteriovoracaceae bacterium]|nr:hypothetical protein [Bacteriovoracaceae bacterium]
MLSIRVTIVKTLAIGSVNPREYRSPMAQQVSNSPAMTSKTQAEKTEIKYSSQILE